MYRAVLSNDGLRVNAYDVVAGERLSHKFKSTGVVFLLIVCRNYHGSVYNQEVGISGWQSVAIVIQRIWHGELEQPIWPAIGIGGLLQLVFKSLKVGILRVVFVVATYIQQSVVWTYAHYCVDMAVGVVADKLSVVEPHYLACTQTLLEHSFHLCLRHRLIAVRSHKTHACSEHRAATVALYRTALKHKVVIVDTLAAEHTLII